MRATSSPGSRRGTPFPWVPALLIFSLATFVICYVVFGQFAVADLILLDTARSTSVDSATATAAAATTTSAITPMYSSSSPDWSRANPLGIPQGQAPNLPSIRVESGENEENVDNKRNIYGGAGDRKHLGGFTDIDLQGVSPFVWKKMVSDYNVKSVLDVGCGRGISTSWFMDHGLDALCVEGSHDAVQQSMLDNPDKNVVEHDFSRGPWWPEKTYDAAWAIEFLEHVGLNFQFNFFTAFRKSALIFVSSSRHGGWHHVEVHQDDWWINKFEAYGLRYSAALTKQVRDWAKLERGEKTPAFQGKPFNAQHIWLTMKVFVNPFVAALPEHAHLFYEPGCFSKPEGNRKCGEGQDQNKAQLESKLPESFLPMNLTKDMDQKWMDRVERNIAVSK